MMTPTTPLDEKIDQMIQDTYELNFMARNAEPVRKLLMEIKDERLEKEDKEDSQIKIAI